MFFNDCFILLRLKKKTILKTVFAMKLIAIFLLATFMTASARGTAQQLNLSGRNVSLETLFGEIKKQTGYTFVYTEALMQKAKKVTIVAKNASLEAVLNECFKDQPLNYTIL